MSAITFDRFLEFVHYTDRTIDRHRQGWKILFDQLAKDQPELLEAGAGWMLAHQGAVTLDFPQLQLLLGRAICMPPKVAAGMRNALAVLGIDRSRRQVAHFLAQVLHESGGLTHRLELASGEAYEGRKDLGNTEPGDGVKFKGAGYLQVTGRYNYALFHHWLQEQGDVMRTDGRDPAKVLEEGATYVAEHYAWESAAWWWARHRMPERISRPDVTVEQVSTWVNQGPNASFDPEHPPNGLEDRRKCFQALVQSLRGGNCEAQQVGEEPGLGATGRVLLDVPYQSQHDNDSGQGYRECFSSSCAMLAMYWGKVDNDDEYNRVRARFGDTTDAQAQVRALEHLGLTARFSQSFDAALLEEEVRAGRPVAVGWLHHGPVYAPTGGGHWSVVVGVDEESFYHNDPNGEARLGSGGYVSADGGCCVAYSRKNWVPRWEVKRGDGWVIICRP